MTRLLLTCLGSLLLCQGVASADVTGVAITSDAALGTFAGKPYREGRLEVSGRAPGGPYRVPVTIAYPTRPADSNGAALVDVPDTTASAPLVAARADLSARRGMPRGAPLGAYGGLLRDTADPLLSESGTFTGSRSPGCGSFTPRTRTTSSASPARPTGSSRGATC